MNLTGSNSHIQIERDDAGVPRVSAESRDDALLGLGFCHARDRGLQMLLARILGRGQASEFLEATDEMFELDRFFRGLNFSHDAAAQLDALSPESRAGLDAYCRGVNLWFRERGNIPWELRLLGYRLTGEGWTAADAFLTARLVTDLATDEAHTALAGGPSDRRFSSWYASDVENWLHGRFKTLSIAP